jgi:hypothetical protein
VEWNFTDNEEPAGLVYSANVTLNGIAGILDYAHAGSTPGTGSFYAVRKTAGAAAAVSPKDHDLPRGPHKQDLKLSQSQVKQSIQIPSSRSFVNPGMGDDWAETKKGRILSRRGQSMQAGSGRNVVFCEITHIVTRLLKRLPVGSALACLVILNGPEGRRLILRRR